MSRTTFEITSTLNQPAADVWRAVSTMEGVNAEMHPWFRMTVPAQMRGRALTEAPVGQRLGRLWLLAFGVLPVDYDDLTLISIEPLAFSESSVMLTQRAWRHERRVVASFDGATCQLTDRLSWDRRFPGTGPILARLIPALFQHRHRRLRARFGGVEEAKPHGK